MISTQALLTSNNYLICCFYNLLHSDANEYLHSVCRMATVSLPGTNSIEKTVFLNIVFHAKLEFPLFSGFTVVPFNQLRSLLFFNITFHVPMGRFQLESKLELTLFSGSSSFTVVFVPVGFSSFLRYLRLVLLDVEVSSVAQPGQLTVGVQIRVIILI